jgi:DNA-binding response OmpR family regulator
MEVLAVSSNREAIELRGERPTDQRARLPARPAVLIVEDDSLLRITTASYLRDEGFDVIEAADADQAIRVLGYTEVDAVFSDLSRPGSANSLALGRWLRRMRPQVGFLLTSATEQTAAESQEWGLLLSKPYQFSDLSHHLRSILGR